MLCLHTFSKDVPMRFQNSPGTCLLRGIALLFALILIGGCQNSSTEPQISEDGRIQLKLALNWFPEPEHGGFYAGLLNGHFEREGLEVEILPGGPAAPVIEKLVREQVQFAVTNADEVLLKRNQQTDVVCIMAALQHSPRCIMVHEGSGINRLEDLKDVTLAMNRGKAFAEYLESKCELQNVRIVQYNGRIGPFVADNAYAQQAYVFSEPILAEREGANPKTLMVSELGFDPYTSCLAVTEDFAKESPETVERFVRACQKGWQDYLADPSAVHAHLLTLNSELDSDSLEKAHLAILPLCQTPAGMPLGALAPERWATLKRQLVGIDFVDAQLDEKQAFQGDFLDDIDLNDVSESNATSDGEVTE